MFTSVYFPPNYFAPNYWSGDQDETPPEEELLMSAIAIGYFDIWQEHYASATVRIYKAGTTTLADVFLDEALTSPADNPQVLLSQTINDQTFGKFLAPLYTEQAYYLDINSTEQTGILRPPITTLDGEDASPAVVKATGGLSSHTLADILARQIYVEDYGEFLNTGDPGQSASTNNTTLTVAIGAAAGRGGGYVVIPAGTFAYTNITLPAGVVLIGQGEDATILQSQLADKVVTLSGAEAGLLNMTLDGVNLQAGSIGIWAKAVDYIRFSEFKIKRFDTGLYLQGGRKAEWNNFYINNCNTGAKLHGDIDPGGGADGDDFRHNRWTGGLVNECINIGVQLSYESLRCWHNTIGDVGFEDNLGTALDINGARYTKLPGCWWTGNVKNWNIDDDDDTDNDHLNTVVGLKFDGGSVSGGNASFKGKCQDIVLSSMELSDVDFVLTLPGNNIVVRDCVEDALVTIADDGTKWTRTRTMLANPPGSSGITTDAVPTKAWSVALEPGQRGHLRATIVGNQRNGIDHAVYHISRPVHRPGSTLDYDTQSVDFTLGEVLTGGTSGATALIIADADGGATGTLTLRDIDGTFLNGEAITDGLGGSALANGAVTDVDAALLGSTASITAAVETDATWDADFGIAAGEIEIVVTGAADKTIEWVVHVETVLD